MRFIKYILTFFILLLSFGISNVNAVGGGLIDVNINNGVSDNNLKTGNNKSPNSTQTNSHLNELDDGEFYGVSTRGETGISNFLYNIARSLKNIFFVIAGIYFMILVLRLIFTENSEEEVDKFKKGIIWISVGLAIMQISFSFVNILFDQRPSEGLAQKFLEDLVYPIIDLLETGASFIFIAIAIYAFFRIVTANGEEEKVKTGRMSVFYALIGFIVIKLSKGLVDTIYGKVDCNNKSILGIIEINNNNCVIEENLSGSIKLLTNVINWVNSFVGILVLILIIYAGFQIIFSNGEEEKVSKAKKSIMYIIIGILLLFVNYLILTFFIIPESVI